MKSDVAGTVVYAALVATLVAFIGPLTIAGIESFVTWDSYDFEKILQGTPFLVRLWVVLFVLLLPLVLLTRTKEKGRE